MNYSTCETYLYHFLPNIEDFQNLFYLNTFILDLSIDNLISNTIENIVTP